VPDHSDLGFVADDHGDLGFVPAAPEDTHGLAAKVAHYAAKALPVAGSLAGGIGGVVGGAPTGPGAILTSMLGTGLGYGAGRSAQKSIDQALGYEKPQTVVEGAKEVLPEAAKDAALAGVTGMALQSAAAAAPMAGDLLKSAARATERRILANVGGSLKSTKPVADAALDEVAGRGAFKLGGTSKGAAERIEGMRESVGDQYARIVKALEAKGITGPDAQALAQQYTAEGQAVNATTMNPSVPAIYESAAQQVATKPTQAGRLGLSQTEDLKRSLQGMAKSAYKQMQPNEVGQAHEATASMMRQSVEDEIAQQTANAAPDVQAIADQFVPIKQSAGNIIQASNAAREGAARAANRNLVSLPDLLAMTGGYAHGGPLQATLSAAASHLARSRVPSTAAVSLRAGDRLLQWLAPRVAQEAPVLGSAAAAGSDIPPMQLGDLLKALRQKSSPYLPEWAQADQQ
jgi:hypothetical protein